MGNQMMADCKLPEQKFRNGTISSCPILFEVPIIREDVCDLALYEHKYVHDNADCGYLCGTSVAGCHVIAAAMAYSYFESGAFPTNLLTFNRRTGAVGCDLGWEDVYGLQHKGFVDLYNQSSDTRFELKRSEYSGKLKFFEKELEIDNRLSAGQIGIIQLYYTFNGRSVLHAITLVGKVGNKYIVNDEYYQQDNKSCEAPGGIVYGELEETINQILTIRNADVVRLNMISFYTRENGEVGKDIAVTSAPSLYQCKKYNLNYE